jgi:hypothetical protein
MTAKQPVLVAALLLPASQVVSKVRLS